MAKRAKSGVPAFTSEVEERSFWESHDSAGRVDWAAASRVRFPNLRPSTTAISLRLPLPLLERIKIEAHKRDVPYQSLIKMWLAEKAEMIGRGDSAAQRAERVPPAGQRSTPPSDQRERSSRKRRAASLAAGR